MRRPRAAADARRAQDGRVPLDTTEQGSGNGRRRSAAGGWSRIALIPRERTGGSVVLLLHTGRRRIGETTGATTAAAASIVAAIIVTISIEASSSSSAIIVIVPGMVTATLVLFAVHRGHAELAHDVPAGAGRRHLIPVVVAVPILGGCSELVVDTTTIKAVVVVVIRIIAAAADALGRTRIAQADFDVPLGLGLDQRVQCHAVVIVEIVSDISVFKGRIPVRGHYCDLG